MTTTLPIPFSEVGVAGPGFLVYLIHFLFAAWRLGVWDANLARREWNMAETEEEYRKLFERAAGGDWQAAKELIEAVAEFGHDRQQQSVFASCLRGGIEGTNQDRSNDSAVQNPVSAVLAAFISSFDGMLHHWANGYRGFGYQYQDDLVSTGQLWLYDCLMHYRPGGGSFLSFASVVIRHRMINRLRELTEYRGNAALRRSIDAVEEEWLRDVGRLPDPEAIADILDVPIDRIYATKPQSRLISLQHRSGPDSPAVGDALPDERATVPLSAMASRETVDFVNLALRVLDRLYENWGTVFRLQFYEGLNSREIAAELGYTYGNVRKLLTFARKTLRCVIDRARVVDRVGNADCGVRVLFGWVRCCAVAAKRKKAKAT